MSATLTYIFTDFIAPVDSAMIAQNAIEHYLIGRKDEPEFGIKTWQFCIGIGTLILTQVLIYMRERYVRFQDAMDINTFFNYWNMTLIGRIDHQICVLEHNIPIIKSLIVDKVMPKDREKPIVVEMDLDRILSIKVEKIVDVFIRYKKYKDKSKKELIHLSNKQFANYIQIKNALAQYEEVTKKNQDEVFIMLNKTMLDFTTILFKFIKKHHNIQNDTKSTLIEVFKKYELDRTVEDINGRRLQFDFINDIIKTINTGYIQIHELEDFNLVYDAASDLQMKYSNFFNLVRNRLSAELKILSYLQRVRVDICNVQIELLNNKLKRIYNMMYEKYDSEMNSSSHEFSRLLKEGIEEVRKEINKIDAETETEMKEVESAI